jgi:hypothetical protein
MYRIYTLDMFYILNFAIVLWIYGTLNKINGMKLIRTCIFPNVFMRELQFQVAVRDVEV